jgi:hypothetical protein
LKQVSISILMIIMLGCHQAPERLGIGRRATQSEIDSLNISIGPDGRGLPPGVGTVGSGRVVYQEKCASCHGATGTEVNSNRLVAAFGDTVKAKTIGNYWPYATTVFDYIRRAMPYNAPGSLTNEEVYSLTAFLLWRNKIIDSTVAIHAKSLPAVVMPARALYVDDDRRGGNEVR